MKEKTLLEMVHYAALTGLIALYLVINGQPWIVQDWKNWAFLLIIFVIGDKLLHKAFKL